MFWDLLSRAAGAVDLTVPYFLTSGLMCDGWGDVDDDTDQLLAHEMRERGTGMFPDIKELTFADGSKPHDETRIGSFTSPCATWLPQESQTGYVMIVSPPATKGPVRGVVVLVAPISDEGFTFRHRLVAAPLARQGFVSLILQSPFFGRRQLNGQKNFFMRTANMMLLQIPTVSIEAAKLVKYARLAFPGVPLGLAGMSVGGCSAASAFPSAVKEIQSIDGSGESTPLVLCGFVPPSQCSILFSSRFSRLFDYGALTLDRPGYRTVEDVKARLAERFQTHDATTCFDLLRGQDFCPSPRLTFSLLCAKHDYVVVREDTMRLYEAGRAVIADIRLRFLSGGHLSNIAQTSQIMPHAIVESFQAPDPSFTNAAAVAEKVQDDSQQLSPRSRL
ncbi:Protein ABHD18 [Hondaea fermentalgiana]|uniref:Protein ABHD18 n=1 Tax=Hondaea fermentalgiana TaxID=2315210 RepID=A0A2R5GL49_9STRA|nr:Protein ABHD18 [Hondaea fermentalgiana]|eukprot:GBG31632.1 Protein ABHD18 [Hondaea fermentalgiana]